MPIERPPARLRTARLVARPVVAADLEFILALFARPNMRSHRPDPAPDSAETLRARLIAEIARWRDEGFGRWRLDDAGGPVGLGGLSRKPGFDGLNLSFHIHPDAWGRGYATEFGRAALAHAFGPLGADRVIGLARAANPASRAVLTRLGFAYLGEVPLGPAPTGLFERRAGG